MATRQRGTTRPASSRPSSGVAPRPPSGRRGHCVPRRRPRGLPVRAPRRRRRIGGRVMTRRGASGGTAMNEETIVTEGLRRVDPAERATYLDAACAGDAALGGGSRTCWPPARRETLREPPRAAAHRLRERSRPAERPSPPRKCREPRRRRKRSPMPLHPPRSPTATGDGDRLARRRGRPPAARAARGPGPGHRPVQAARADRRGRHGHRLHGRADRAGPPHGRLEGHQAGHGHAARCWPASRPSARPWP